MNLWKQLPRHLGPHAVHSLRRAAPCLKASSSRRRRCELVVEALEERTLLSFAPAVNYPVGSQPIAVVVADFNADGRQDVAVTNYSSQTVGVLLSNGNGTFQPQVSYGTGLYPYSLAVGDFNGDGGPDLVTPTRVSGAVSVLRGNGDGPFRPAVSSPAGTFPAHVAVGDFNRDGRLDLATANLT